MANEHVIMVFAAHVLSRTYPRFLMRTGCILLQDGMCGPRCVYKDLVWRRVTIQIDSGERFTGRVIEQRPDYLVLDDDHPRGKSRRFGMNRIKLVEWESERHFPNHGR